MYLALVSEFDCRSGTDKGLAYALDEDESDIESPLLLEVI